MDLRWRSNFLFLFHLFLLSLLLFSFYTCLAFFRSVLQATKLIAFVFICIIIINNNHTDYLNVYYVVVRVKKLIQYKYSGLLICHNFTRIFLATLHFNIHITVYSITIMMPVSWITKFKRKRAQSTYIAEIFAKPQINVKLFVGFH